MLNKQNRHVCPGLIADMASRIANKRQAKTIESISTDTHAIVHALQLAIDLDPETTTVHDFLKTLRDLQD